jgi:hypothetical protein
LRTLLPHPKAAIFIADYEGDYKKLSNYLNYLSNNETAYEEHREWRKDFTYEKNIKDKKLLQTSWYCRMCQYAIDNLKNINSKNLDKICEKNEKINKFSDFISYFNNSSVKIDRNNDFYIVENNTLRFIPNQDTYVSLKLDYNAVINIPENEFKKCVKGDPIPPVTYK